MEITELMVIKCGGSTMEQLPPLFYKELTLLREKGVTPILVHGGGPAISSMLNRLQIKPRFIDGMRVTDEATLEVVEMVLVGQINKHLVRQIHLAGGKSIGLCGSDGFLIEADPLPGNLGCVGEIKTVNPSVIFDLVKLGYIPVIAPIGVDRKGNRYNINADIAAGAIASHLGVKQLVMITDVPGIMAEVNGKKQVIPLLDEKKVLEMMNSGEIYGGMIPKVRASLDCLNESVQEVIIVRGIDEGVLHKVLEGESVGTRIRKGEVA
ncbi:acetylglutamate kinase [Microaerobacter geothermalis]|uniref:acetylglutamate kinase n=1 Tax=Microaerobacter geothermalis TaxID=674972 RepID=UPI001F33D197|nr:acetylglutamate kinase [Microaerobacter geothermalis]MCF6093445.1 acetylglutamate kinase [Microaerobacter geothermalis]